MRKFWHSTSHLALHTAPTTALTGLSGRSADGIVPPAALVTRPANLAVGSQDGPGPRTQHAQHLHYPLRQRALPTQVRSGQERYASRR
jgi:hypothetical protein